MTFSIISKCCIKNNSADNFIVKIGHVGSLEPAIDLGCESAIRLPPSPVNITTGIT